MFLALVRQRVSATSLMEGSEVPMIFSAVLTTLCTVFQSDALQLPDQTEMQLVMMLSIVPLQKVVRMGGGSWALLMRRRKNSRFCALFTSEAVFEDHVRLSVICTPRNLVLLTTSTAVSSMRSGLLSFHHVPAGEDHTLSFKEKLLGCGPCRALTRPTV